MEQRERRPSLICDYSFYEVNQDTHRIGPEEAMQFARELERLMYTIWHANPRFGPVYLGKVDLADGFYRLRLALSAMLKLAVIFPSYPDEEELIALPFTLPMGWVNSVPYFCSATETVADLANNIPSNTKLPPHPLEELANTPPPDLQKPTALTPTTSPLKSSGCDNTRASTDPLPVSVLRPFQKPVRNTGIYLDDFIMSIQGNSNARLQHLRRLLYSIDAVFRPVEDDEEHRKHVPSIKKFLKGDAFLCLWKLILGWILDSYAHTLTLPPHRQARLQEIFDKLRHKKRVSEKLWRKVLGELRSMSIGIPGSRGLFSQLQEGLKYTEKGRLRVTSDMEDQLADFEYLAQGLAKRPTHLSELVPDHPVAVGPHDASGTGMGGIWIPAITNSNLNPILWRDKFPSSITQQLVSFDNPHGTVTNSDLELAGGIAHADVLVQEVNCCGRTVVPFTDNTPTLAWLHKGSTSTTGPAAYLLRIASIHQRHYRYLAKPDFIKGDVNNMADDCSRLWKLTDSQLLAYFNHTYPQSRTLEACTPETRNAFRADLGIAEAEAGASVVPRRSRAQDGHWKVWEDFIADFDGVDVYLTKLNQHLKLHFLQVFATRLRRGLITPSGKPIRSRQVEDYLRTVGAEIADVDHQDPRLTPSGRLHNKISKLQRSYKKDDPPPHRVKPIPIPLLRHMAENNQHNVHSRAVADCGIIGLYYLLRPGEYTYAKDNDHPFRLEDVSFLYTTSNGQRRQYIT